MANRVLKESIKRSPQIDSLTWFEEVTFYRLIVTADDYGCADGRLVVLRNDLFPTKESITRKSIEDAIKRLVSVGLVSEYTVDGSPYLFLNTWEKHQRVRTKKRKYPAPPTDCGKPTTSCGKLPQIAADCRLESNPNPNPNPNPEKPPVAPQTGGGAGAPLEGLSPELRDALAEFRQMRTKMRKPMTDKAVARLLDRLEKLAPGDAARQAAIVCQSVDRGWTDVYELKETQDGTCRGRSGHKDGSASEIADSLASLYVEE